jgi:hypothetical protein
MDGTRVIIPKRRWLMGKTVWIFGVFLVAIVIGTGVQMKMTWSRERLRGISSDTSDVVTAAKEGFSALAPKENIIEPIGDLLHSSVEGSSVPPETNSN